MGNTSSASLIWGLRVRDDDGYYGEQTEPAKRYHVGGRVELFLAFPILLYLVSALPHTPP